MLACPFTEMLTSSDTNLYLSMSSDLHFCWSFASTTFLLSAFSAAFLFFKNRPVILTGYHHLRRFFLFDFDMSKKSKITKFALSTILRWTVHPAWSRLLVPEVKQIRAASTAAQIVGRRGSILFPACTNNFHYYNHGSRPKTNMARGLCAPRHDAAIDSRGAVFLW